MNENPRRSRWMIIIVSVITVILLLGSAILQRIAFKAEVANAPLYLDPPSFAVAPNAGIGLSLKANFTELTFVLGASFQLEYDPSLINFEQAKPSENWRTVVVNSSEGKVKWVVAPTQSQGATVKLKGTSSFGTVEFSAIKAGTAQVNIDPAKTILALLDPAANPNIKNGLSSVQNTAGLIGESITQPTDFSHQTEIALEADAGQRLLSSEVVPLSDSALALVRLQYLGRVKVLFGQRPEVGNEAESHDLVKNHALQIVGLTPQTNYYYQVIAEDQDGVSRQSSPLKSFTTAPASNEAIDLKSSDFFAFPIFAADEATLYWRLRDTTGGVVSGATINVASESKNVTIHPVTEVAGLYRAVVSSSSNRKHRATFTASIGQASLGAQSVVFDPQMVESSAVPRISNLITVLNSRTVLTIVILVVALVLSVLLLTRLAKAK